jgi:putative ABC transport system permease protein
MLTLKNITKNYVIGELVVRALRGINLSFRDKEFVAILGPSGCGKTTLLNIIGGLDRYTTGDLLVDNTSTKEFKDPDWDAYRNMRIGFVFQNYNLISHISVIQNVELALTISGVSAKERKERAREVLIQVGLEDQLYKRPNQLSGGQMQRVAIARALVNNPNIILADEPTGALDSKTSTQIMELLKSISEDKLIIMVTHNSAIAERYSNRLINLLDGEVISDTKPYTEKEEPLKKEKKVRTSMSFPTALKLSWNNLITKKVRTIITAIAGSIGIIGVALVLSLSNGFSNYISKLQLDTLAGYPVRINEFSFIIPQGPPVEDEGDVLFPATQFLLPYDEPEPNFIQNIITEDYVNYVKELSDTLWTSDLQFYYRVNPNFLFKNDEDVISVISAPQIGFRQLEANQDFILQQYDLLYGAYPEDGTLEVVLIVDKYNRLPIEVTNALGFGTNAINFQDIVNLTLKLVPNDLYYQKFSDSVYFLNPDFASMYNDVDSRTITISGILRVKETVESEILTPGIAYTTDLTEYLLDSSESSMIVADQLNSPTKNILTQQNILDENALKSWIQFLGGTREVISIDIYPVDFEAKDNITNYLDDWNLDHTEQIVYTDLADIISSFTDTLINSISYVLIAFASISLFVSSIMIGIITYVSVVERTKEIGVLRSIGARKKDISRVFNAETLIIGFVAGTFGVLITFLLNPIINQVLYKFTEVRNISELEILSALLLILVSMSLTLVAGLIPARIASKKDPVVALRTE